MKTIGIVCEYNPFHNGHLYHINKIKEMFPDSIIIAVMSGNFTQRGIPSILSKEEKTKIALEHNIDLVIELPFIFATQSADIFANAATTILNYLKVDYLVFGSESNNVENLIELAKISLYDTNYEEKVKSLLKNGTNYPTALSSALKDLSNIGITSPNDILGLTYIKSIIKNNYNITPLTIQRTNDFHSNKLDSNIASATAIRTAISNNQLIKGFVPKDVEILLEKKHIPNYFPYLKYKILVEGKNINRYLMVDEGIENRILKYINESSTLDELITKVKTKRYTYNKIARMFIHILCSTLKDDAEDNNIKYIRILGFNDSGRTHLNKIKKDINIPLITTPKYYNDLLVIDNKVDKIYELIVNSFN